MACLMIAIGEWRLADMSFKCVTECGWCGETTLEGDLLHRVIRAGKFFLGHSQTASKQNLMGRFIQVTAEKGM